MYKPELREFVVPNTRQILFTLLVVLCVLSGTRATTHVLHETASQTALNSYAGTLTVVPQPDSVAATFIVSATVPSAKVELQ